MTYIEFFDRTASENISACLTYVPDRVIYIGDNSNLIKRHIEDYSRVFQKRGHEITFIHKTVSKSNLENAVAQLTKIVNEYDDCVFDITGGEEILNLALGIVYAQNPHKNIQIHRFNLRNNTIHDCDKDGKTIYKNPPALSVEENIRIYGGDVVYGPVTGKTTYRWEMTPEFCDDLEKMWTICKAHLRSWNGQLNVLHAASEVGVFSPDGLTVTASRAAVIDWLQQKRLKYKRSPEIISKLVRQGFLTYFEETDQSVTVSFKNLQVRRCLTKAGQVLEMKTYMIARNILEDDGTPVYNDVLNGVFIDWDGDIHDTNTKGVYDTTNEIDVMMMHDVVPVYISCKNGFVTADELYKLNTVAERFGRQYSRKLLVATSISTMGKAGEYLRQRAQDMDIRLVEDVQTMSDEEFARKLRYAWSK